jgi:hypothetical protein
MSDGIPNMSDAGSFTRKKQASIEGPADPSLSSGGHSLDLEISKFIKTITTKYLGSDYKGHRDSHQISKNLFPDEQATYKTLIQQLITQRHLSKYQAETKINTQFEKLLSN